MGRWIDTDAAYAVLTDYYHHSTDTQHAALREALGRVETVDAVPVVRCRDCKHWRKYTDEQFGECMMTTRDTKVTRSDDYCSESERKDGEQHG